jgi:hypothetical protein
MPVPDACAAEADAPGRRRLVAKAPIAWLIVPVIIALAVLVSTVLPPTSRTGLAPQASGPPPERSPIGLFPFQLAHVTTGTDDGPGPLLFFGHGVSAGDWVAYSGRGAIHFAWAPDGRHSAVIDVSGRLHLLPSDRSIEGPVKSFAFSPDGSSVAVCAGLRWPPRITIYPVDAASGQIGPTFEGCDPQWSADGTYVAYRIPADPQALNQGVYDPGQFEVLNTHVNLRFGIDGVWPFAWAPDSGHGLVPLATVSGDERSIDIMDPRGGVRRTLVSRSFLHGLLAGARVGPITLLAWSPDGERLALGFGAGPNGEGPGVAVVDPSTSYSVFFAEHDPVVSLSWSVRDDLLVAVGVAGAGRTWVVRSGIVREPPALYVRQATWSPDGRWILARGTDGWVVIDAFNPQALTPIEGSWNWALATWCCPPAAATGRNGQASTSD